MESFPEIDSGGFWGSKHRNPPEGSEHFGCDYRAIIINCQVTLYTLYFMQGNGDNTGFRLFNANKIVEQDGG
jgi:hypothetical protein